MGIRPAFGARPERILSGSDDTLRMYEDLGMDSLTMLEVVMLVEQTLEVSIDNEELRDLELLEM